MPDSITPSDVSDAQIAHVSVKPPPFWKSHPTLWFVRLESQFSLAKITAEETKFNHVVAALDADVLFSISDIILTPPTTDPYKTLKKRLIDCHSESEASKIRTLLQGLELGDQRPSQLLAQMRSLAQGSSVGEPLLKSLWLGRLPHNTQSILAALNETLDQLANIADKIHETCNQSVVNSVSNLKPQPTCSMESQIAQLSQQVSELTAIVTRRNDNQTLRPYRRFRKRSNSQKYRQFKEPIDGLCFYHTNFGKNAKKCADPCSFNSEN